MGWNPEGFQPDGWQPTGTDPEVSEVQPTATDIVAVSRIIVANPRAYIIRPVSQ